MVEKLDAIHRELKIHHANEDQVHEKQLERLVEIATSVAVLKDRGTR
jgi:hypothetical protein